jgi:hypothetical protein
MDLKTALSLAYGKPIPKAESLRVLNNTQVRHTGKRALKPYLGIVEYPISRGGGTAWLKSKTALQNYEDKNYKVVWL